MIFKEKIHRQLVVHYPGMKIIARRCAVFKKKTEGFFLPAANGTLGKNSEGGSR